MKERIIKYKREIICRHSLGRISKTMEVHFSVKVLLSYTLNIMKWSMSRIQNNSSLHSKIIGKIQDLKFLIL